MALVVKDRVRENSTTTGTGTFTLSGAVSGFQTFSSAIGNTNTTYYAIVNGAEWEVGLGTVSAGALSRDTILESSNSGSAVNFSAGTKDVFCTYPAEKSVYRNSSDVAVLTSTDITTGLGYTPLAPSNNLSDVSSAATARTNLGVTATGADTTYAYRANNLSDLANATTARTNLGLGSIATQASSSVSITGGTIDGTSIGATTPAAVTGTNLAASNGIITHNATVSASYTFPTGHNGIAVGPVTISSGVTVTVPTGQRWMVL